MSSLLQEFLPPGIEVDKELADAITSPPPGKFFRVRDARAFPEMPLVRFLRLFDSAQDANGTAGIRDRVQQLMKGSFPFVLTPCEAGSLPEGGFFFLESERGHSLAAKWPSPADRPAAMRHLEQLLTGLESLHDQGMPHGDVRPDNITLLPGASGHKIETAWLANTPLGGLTQRTGGACVAADMKYYFPPEWNGRAQALSPTADLYALGVVAHKLACGPNAIPAAVPADSWTGRFRKTLVHWLSGDDLDGLKHLLLQDVSSRPKHGREALQRFQRWRQWVSWRGLLLILLPLLLILMIFVIGMVWWWWAATLSELKQQNLRLLQETESAVARVDELDQQNKDLRRDKDKQIHESGAKIALLEEKIRGLTPRPPGNSPPPPDPRLAQAAWKAAVEEANGDYDPEIWNKHLQQIPDKDRPASRPFFRGWEKIILDRRGKAAVWKGHDKDLESRWKQVLRQPWEKERVAQFDQRFAALDFAASTWKGWSEIDHLKFGDLRSQTASEPEEVQRILHGWLNGTEAQTEWKLRLKSGTAPAGYGTYRGICIEGDGWTEDWHNWSEPTSHQYQNRMLTFRWIHGKPLIIRIYTGRTIYYAGTRPMPLNLSFNGPLPLWRARQYGSVSQNGFTLEFEVNDCPGPPRSVLSDLSQTAQELLQ